MPVFVCRGEALRFLNKKGQAAVEFLSTYGWALLAVLLAVGVLGYFNFLDVGRYVSERCELGTQIQCVETNLNANGDLSVVVRNNYPVAINMPGFTATMQDGSTETLSIDQDVGSGQTTTFTIANFDNRDFNVGDKVEFDFEIEFRRATAATAPYTTRGSAIIKVART